jgi:N-acetylglucosamine-6-phosphate deacetylase
MRENQLEGNDILNRSTLASGNSSSSICARDYRSAQWTELDIRGRVIGAVRQISGPDEISLSDCWVAPAFWDIQLNGRWGFSFSSPELTVEQVTAIVRAQGALGTARLCPTLISAPAEDLRHGVSLIAAACDQSPEISRMVLGIHLEGPFLSDREGYRGAHPKEALRDPDWGLFQELQAASGNRIVLLTMAPERPGSIEFIARAAESGVVIALGHTAADGETIDRAVRAGARLSTHLGNGIAAHLPRHPNPIWHQAARDELFASLIADGHHLDRATLRVLARAKGLANLILISDAGPLAGLPAGTYGDWAVDPSGKIVVAGTPYLAGSNQGLETGLQSLMSAVPCSVAEAISTVTSNPARLLGLSWKPFEPGGPANLVVVHLPDPTGFLVQKTCVDGVWQAAAN